MQHTFRSGRPGGGYAVAWWVGVRCSTTQKIKKALKNERQKYFQNFKKAIDIYETP